jgi:hypothetical protein
MASLPAMAVLPLRAFAPCCFESRGEPGDLAVPVLPERSLAAPVLPARPLAQCHNACHSEFSIAHTNRLANDSSGRDWNMLGPLSQNPQSRRGRSCMRPCPWGLAVGTGTASSGGSSAAAGLVDKLPRQVTTAKLSSEALTAVGTTKYFLLYESAEYVSIGSPPRSAPPPHVRGNAAVQPTVGSGKRPPVWSNHGFGIWKIDECSTYIAPSASPGN